MSNNSDILSTNQPVDLSVMNDHIKNILVTISKNPITNVISSTGTGKTTKLPIGIAEAGNRIIVVVSNDIIAKSLVKYVSTITNETVSTNISDNARIKYISESNLKGYIYKTINDNGCLDFTDILMIDQADRGSMDQYLVMALWRYCALRNLKVPRLLLVSTTQTVSLSSFGNNNNQGDNIYFIDNNYYPVEIRYTKDYSISDSTLLIDDTIKLVYELHNSSVVGDILVFTSGKNQTVNIVDRLNEINMKDAIILSAHNESTQEDIDKIYQPSKERKIIVTDKLAETSLTLDNLGIIIDMMIDYRKELSLTGGQRYPRRYVTQSQANLRSSRGGKYLPTVSYRMMSQELFDRLLYDVEPEIFRVPLHWVMLELIENKVDPYNVLDMFDETILDRMYKLIINLNLVNINGIITDTGKFSRKSLYGIRQAVALYRWLEKGYPAYPAITILSMIDAYSKSYYVYPLKDNGVDHAEYNLELLEHRKTYFEPFAGRSDIHTYGNIWTIMMEEVGGPEAPSSDIQDWCKNNYINHHNIEESISLNNNTISVLNDMNVVVEVGPYNIDNLLNLLIPILKEIYSDKTLTYDNMKDIVVTYVGADGVYKIDNGAVNTIEMDIPPVIYGLIVSVIRSDYSADFNTVVVSLCD